MAYILGFIASDGNILSYSDTERRERYRLSIGLQKVDQEILNKIKNELEFEGKLKFRKINTKGKEHDVAELMIFSKEIIKDLNNIGLYSVKSFTVQFPNIPNEFVLDFIRGYFDGDGSIGIQRIKNKNSKNDIPQIRVRISSGSEALLEVMQKELTIYGLKPKKVIHYKSGIYEIAYSTKESIKLYDLFYKNSECLKLERKYNKFKEAIDLRNSVTSKIDKYIKVN